MLARSGGEPFDEQAYADAAARPRSPRSSSKQVELGIDVIDDGEMRQAELRHLRQRAARRLRADDRRRRRAAFGRPRARRAIPRFYQRSSATRRARRPRAWSAPARSPTRATRAPARHRQPQGRARGRERRRSVHAGDLAVQRRGLAPQRILQDRRGVSRSPSPTRCARNTRRSSTPASCCRSTIRGSSPTTSASRPEHRGMPQLGASCASRRSTTRCATSRRESIRFHTCYGINMGPRIHDMELKDIVDIILKVAPAPIRSRPPIRATSTNGRCGGRQAAGGQDRSSRASSRIRPCWSSIPSSSPSASCASPTWSDART